VAQIVAEIKKKIIMNKLLKDAIADAKAVRETALAQAKLALEEAFAPKLQSMLSNKIREEMEEEPRNNDDSMDDESMRMRELAGLSEKDDDFGGDEDYGSDDDMGGDEPAEDDTDFSSDDNLDGEDEEDSDDDLEEILRQLEEEEDGTEDDSVDMDSEGEENHQYKGGEYIGDEPDEDMDEEINLDELITSLKEDDDYGMTDDQPADTDEEDHSKPDPMDERKKMNKMKAELNEAYTAVKFLREKLSEVNLLNAKLLYVNRLFRKSGLSEGQKVKIIETFDRARNVREAKLIYATLSESFTTPTKSKKAVMENFASAPVKKTRVITEGNEQANRFKTLAGIIKS